MANTLPSFQRLAPWPNKSVMCRPNTPWHGWMTPSSPWPYNPPPTHIVLVDPPHSTLGLGIHKSLTYSSTISQATYTPRRVICRHTGGNIKVNNRRPDLATLTDGFFAYLQHSTFRDPLKAFSNPAVYMLTKCIACGISFHAGLA